MKIEKFNYIFLLFIIIVIALLFLVKAVAPSISTPIISPIPAYSVDELTCKTNYTDNDSDTGNIRFRWYKNNTVLYGVGEENDTEDAWFADNLCYPSYPCSNAVDEDWSTAACAAYAYSNVTIYENMTIPSNWSLSNLTANWSAMVSVTYTGTNIAAIYVWNYSSNAWVQKYYISQSGIWYPNFEIPSEALTSSPLQIKTYLFEHYHAFYYEGKVTWFGDYVNTSVANGTEISHVLKSGNFSAGDEIICSVMATDNTSNSSAWSNSSTLIIGTNKLIIEGNATVPVTPFIDSPTYIEANISDVNNLSIIWVNFTLKAPNGTNVISNVNGTWISGNTSNGSTEVWRSANYTIDKNGVWNWSFTASNNKKHTNSSSGSFTAGNFTYGIYPTYDKELIQSIISGDTILFNLSLYTNKGDSFNFTFNYSLNSSYFNITFANDSLLVNSTEIKNEVNITSLVTTPNGTYSGNITITRIFDNANYTINLTIGVTLINPGNVYIEDMAGWTVSMYNDESNNNSWTVNNTGVYGLSSCNASLGGSYVGEAFYSFSPSNFSLESSNITNLTLTFTSPTAGSYTGYLDIKCVATPGGDLDALSPGNKPYIRLTSSTRPAVTPSGGGVSPLREGYASALIRHPDDTHEYTDLERAIIFARIFNYTNIYGKDLTADQKNELLVTIVKEVEITIPTLNLWLEQFKADKIEVIKMLEDTIKRYNLVLTVVEFSISPAKMIRKGEFLITPFYLRFRQYNFTYTLLSNYGLKDCALVSGDKDYSCSVNETTLNIIYKPADLTFLSSSPDGVLRVTNVNEESLYLTASFRIFNISYRVIGIPLYISGWFIVGLAILLIKFLIIPLVKMVIAQIRILIRGY